MTRQDRDGFSKRFKHDHPRPYQVEPMAPPQTTNRTPPELQALLETVPQGARTPYGFEDFAPPPSSSAAGHEVQNVEAAVTEMMRAIQGQVSELARAREGLAVSLRDAESQLAKVNAEASNLRAERDHLLRLKALYERKFASIRDLAQQ